MSNDKFNLFSFQGKMRTLHFSWMAFFLTFIVWFNLGPLMVLIQETFSLTEKETKTLLMLNVALTIPARILVGVLVDKFGPRIMYSLLMFICGAIALAFAAADSFQMLAITRFLLGSIGAGFVIGIRLVGEWFPAREVGIAEGIYGGWGNFGSAVAAMVLPLIAALVSQSLGIQDGWRYAVALSGLLCMGFSLLFYWQVRDTPKGSTYFKPKKAGAMEVTSKGDLLLYILMNLPMVLALVVLTWRLSPAGFGLLSQQVTYLIYLLLAVLLAFQLYQIFKVNAENLRQPVAAIHRYKFKQVAILALVYLACFGSEIAVVSMLPLFFKKTFAMSAIGAGLLASTFVAANLVARPGGGLISDKFGRKRSLIWIMAGVTAGYAAMAFIDSSWSLFLVGVVTVVCSFFVQAGCGAVYAMVPLIKRRLTGQIAGMAGAYGNVGGVVFLTALSFVDPHAFFLILAATAAVTLALVFLMDEPQGHTAEVLPDGTVQMINVS